MVLFYLELMIEYSKEAAKAVMVMMQIKRETSEKGETSMAYL